MSIAGRVGNQVRFIFDAAGQIVGLRNPLTDQDEFHLSSTQQAALAPFANASTVSVTIPGVGDSESTIGI